MHQPKTIPAQWSWADLVPAIEPERCILLNGPGDDFILGWEVQSEVKFEQDQFNFDPLNAFLTDQKGHYIFGYLSYDIKNKIEPGLVSKNQDLVKFPDAHFLVMRHVLVKRNDALTYMGPLAVDELTRFFRKPKPFVDAGASIPLKAQTSEPEYKKNFEQIKAALQYGTIYEMNYCLNFFAQDASIHPFQTYLKLNEAAHAPFSCYLNLGDHFALSASPERYLEKKGDRLLSQPIKGTSARGTSPEEDELLQKKLQNDPKERSENVMIVDLVRNDLSKIAEKNSVEVDELFGVYRFKTVHQLISSVSCRLKAGTGFPDIIKATFPMGSMTGAPKISAMQHAEEIENFRRGLYSGTIGYIAPNGDFDFNVVIRSILYNRKERVVSCSVGGAITIHATPENEYAECLLKLHALQKALC
jgi:para-aminobenzoate synthetase component I